MAAATKVKSEAEIQEQFKAYVFRQYHPGIDQLVARTGMEVAPEITAPAEDFYAKVMSGS
jgi:hypothetical protein